MSEPLPIYDSMAAVTGATGIPRHLLQAAKRDGCDAFDHGRVHLDRLLRWLFGRPEKTGEAPTRWKDYFEEWRAKREKIRHDKDAEKLIDEADSAEWFFMFAKEAAGIYYQKLVNEMPSAVAGLDVPSARIYAKRIYNLTMTPLRNLAKKPEMKKLLEKHESDIAAL